MDTKKLGILTFFAVLVIGVVLIGGCIKKGEERIIEKSPVVSKVDIAAVNILFSQIGEDKADLKAIVKNNGGVNIPKITYRFSINEAEEEGSLPVNNLNPGEEFKLDLSHAYSNYYNLYYKYYKSVEKPFELKMVLRLDPKDELKEFDEGNNNVTKMFYMQQEITEHEETPTENYMAYHNALSDGDMKEMKKYLAKNMVTQLEQSGMEDTEILKMIQSTVPKEVKITDEEIKNNSATLIATGNAGYQEGTIEMVKEDGKWKLLKESWQVLE